jgi:D-alanine-D-alanine ligase
MKRTRILILAGGRSEEHEVSITSARSVLAAVAGTRLDASALVVTREGRWLPAGDSQKALTQGNAKHGGELALHSAQIAEQYDVIFPLMHGPMGEDGTVQGMLELAGLPYVGSGVLASALCMDKPMAKEVLRANGIPQVKYLCVTRHAYRTHPKAAVVAIEQTLTAPWFVKPANLGSSVGISKARDTASLTAALDTAFAFDRRVIIEEGVPGVRELEVAILGNDEPKVTPVGEITYQAEFYDYNTKYTDGRSRMHIPADLPPGVAKRIQDIGLSAFRLLDCAGFARVDFFYQPKSGELYLNELNTIPGFTPFSMFPKLWEAAGVSYGELIEKLVDLAIERHSARSR